MWHVALVSRVSVRRRNQIGDEIISTLFFAFSLSFSSILSVSFVSTYLRAKISLKYPTDRERELLNNKLIRKQYYSHKVA